MVFSQNVRDGFGFALDVEEIVPEVHSMFIRPLLLTELRKIVSDENLGLFDLEKGACQDHLRALNLRIGIFSIVQVLL